MDTCAGPLLRFPVRDDDGDDSDALIVCGCCGDIFVAHAGIDPRHSETLVFNA